MKSIYFQKFKIFDIFSFRPTENKKSEFLTKRQKDPDQIEKYK